MKLNSKKQLIDPFENIFYGDVSEEELTHFVGDFDVPIYVDCIGITHPNPKYYIDRKRSEYYVFEYVISGVGHIASGKKTLTVKEGDLYILKENETHHYWADKDNPYEKIWINIHGEIIGQLLAAYKLDDKTVFRNSQCKELFYELLQLSKATQFNDEVCYDAAVVVFKIITRLAQNQREKTYTSTIAKYTKVFLDKNLYGNITVDSIAKSLLVSKAQVISEFKKYYGQTPYSYYIDQKMQIAKHLVASTSSRVSEIAESLGFDEQNHFSNLFKKKVGVSPVEYRKQHNNSPKDKRTSKKKQ